jgi:hypothetical protein
MRAERGIAIARVGRYLPLLLLAALPGCFANRWLQRSSGSDLCVVAPQSVHVLAFSPSRRDKYNPVPAHIDEGKGRRVRFLWPFVDEEGLLVAEHSNGRFAEPFKPWTARGWTWFVGDSLVPRGGC